MSEPMWNEELPDHYLEARGLDDISNELYDLYKSDERQLPFNPLACTLFSDLVCMGLEPETAVEQVRERVARTLDRAREAGLEPTEAANLAGFIPGRELRSTLQEFAHANFVMGEGPLRKIPDPKCVYGKLPKGRRPTEDELRKAWRECGG